MPPVIYPFDPLLEEAFESFSVDKVAEQEILDSVEKFNPSIQKRS